MSAVYRVALAGNPNCGKTTIFNLLTGTRQHVGNYPGVTVERKVGSFKLGNDIQVELVDLPGIYSLSSSSPEEKVAFRELMEHKVDLILNIIDAGNAQRNLYLTTQLAELNIPMLLVFNMIDDAKKRGLVFDIALLEHYFSAPIVETVGSTGEGIANAREVLRNLLTDPSTSAPTPLKYGGPIETAIRQLTDEVAKVPFAASQHIPARYFAIKLLEGDAEVTAMPAFADLLAPAAELRGTLCLRSGMSSENLMADCRYGAIAGACREAITMNSERRQQLTDKIDQVVTNRYLGLPIFLVMMFIMFWFTFTFADPFMFVIEKFFDVLADTVNQYWPDSFLPFLKALVADGIIKGVGGVLVFLPNILFLFLAIAILEGTGYMARAAFIMDGFMHKFGLHGKSFIPMLLGFGCSVPAIMGTRTIESERDRLTTIMVIPMMSCGARLPIYALMIPVFFAEKYQALVLWLLYIIGVVMALCAARLLKSTLFRGGDEVFLMELPPYRMPTLRSILIQMWERAVLYLKKAGTLILGASILLFIINTFPVKKHFTADYDGKIELIKAENSALKSRSEELSRLEQQKLIPAASLTRQLEELKEKIAACDDAIYNLEAKKKEELLEYSIAGRIGHGLALVMKPIGFDWRVSSALIGAFAAKELFVSQLGILYAVGEADEESMPLRSELRKNYTPLQGFCIMLFCLLTVPCMATVAVVRRETNSTALTLLQIAGMTVIAYVMTFIVYQAGSLLNIGTTLLQ